MVYEDRKVDYTSLKIDTLKVESESDQNEEGEETNEDGEKVKKSKEGGPWSKLVASDSIEKPSESEEKIPGMLRLLSFLFNISINRLYLYATKSHYNSKSSNFLRLVPLNTILTCKYFGTLNFLSKFQNCAEHSATSMKKICPKK